MIFLITGGSGYVGSRLLNRLLKNEKIQKLINYDISFFGDDHLPLDNPKYVYEKKDLRDLNSLKEVINKHKVDKVLHLACISNDPTFELNSSISKEINFDCFDPFVKTSKENGVKDFIYASTCSVYGVSDEPEVKEDHPLLPLTDYNKYKAMCEPILLDYIDNNFNGLIIRPATVCGYSEKMRFDLTVNILTNYAFNKGFIKVFGGKQTRPNIHIDDMCNLYEDLLIRDLSGINGQIYNAGQENLSILAIAEKISQQMLERFNKKIEINVEPSNDPRSYRINSDKLIKNYGFKFQKNVDDAIKDLLEAFTNKLIKDSFSDKWINISILKKLESEKKYS
jgi:nucleoside-diphosphate-sugar epimerase